MRQFPAFDPPQWIPAGRLTSEDLMIEAKLFTRRPSQ
jgi:hypothetical protein